MPLTPDTTATDIAADAASALRAAATGSGLVFPGGVLTVEDEATFQRVADPTRGPVAAVVSARPPQYARGYDNGSSAQYRLELRVLFRWASQRAAGKDDAAGVAQMHALADLARQALSADKSRSGKATWTKIGGRVSEPTDLRGEPRLIADRGRAGGTGYYTAALPVVCGWTVPA